MPNLRGPELLILLLIVVLLFAAKRLPDLARSVGRSLRIFKAETKGIVESEVVPDETPAVTRVGQQLAAPAVAAADASRAQQTALQPQPPSQA